MVPPCALTTAATMARPNPVLPPRRERDESPRANRSKISGCSHAGIPGPSSATVSTALPVSLRTLGIPANGGKRGRELVAGLGDDLAHACLAGVAGGQRARDAVQHPVQCRAELTDLGIDASRVDLDDRRRQSHLAAVQF